MKLSQTRISHRLIAGALALVMVGGLFTMPAAARASEEGRRNTAIAIGAVALGLILANNSRHHDDDCRDDRYYGRYDRGYNRGYDRGYARIEYRDYDRNNRYDRSDHYNRSERWDRNDRNNRNDRWDRNDRNDRYNDRGHETHGRR